MVLTPANLDSIALVATVSRFSNTPLVLVIRTLVDCHWKVDEAIASLDCQAQALKEKQAY
jgi:hypothetical protein